MLLTGTVERLHDSGLEHPVRPADGTRRRGREAQSSEVEGYRVKAFVAGEPRYQRSDRGIRSSLETAEIIIVMTETYPSK
jgi:hypothetical protein